MRGARRHMACAAIGDDAQVLPCIPCVAPFRARSVAAAAEMLVATAGPSGCRRGLLRRSRRNSILIFITLFQFDFYQQLGRTACPPATCEPVTPPRSVAGRITTGIEQFVAASATGSMPESSAPQVKVGTERRVYRAARWSVGACDCCAASLRAGA